MRQAASNFIQDLSASSGLTAEPVGAVGWDLTAVSDGAMRAANYRLKITVGGTGSAKVAMRVRDEADAWGVAGENEAQVNLGAAMTAGKTYFFEVENLGTYKRARALLSEITSGAPTISTWLSAVYERGD